MEYIKTVRATDYDLSLNRVEIEEAIMQWIESNVDPEVLERRDIPKGAHLYWSMDDTRLRPVEVRLSWTDEDVDKD